MHNQLFKIFTLVLYAYEGVVTTLNPQIEKLIGQLNMLHYEENNTTVDVAELKAHILRQLFPKHSIAELTPTVL